MLSHVATELVVVLIGAVLNPPKTIWVLLAIQSIPAAGFCLRAMLCRCCKECTNSITWQLDSLSLVVGALDSQRKAKLMRHQETTIDKK